MVISGFKCPSTTFWDMIDDLPEFVSAVLGDVRRLTRPHGFAFRLPELTEVPFQLSKYLTWLKQEANEGNTTSIGTLERCVMCVLLLPTKEIPGSGRVPVGGGE